MPAKPKRPGFYEPWHTTKDIVDRGEFVPPRDVEPEYVDRLRSQHERSQKDCDVFLWGKGVDDPAPATSPSTGEKRVHPGDGIVAKCRRIATFRDDGPHHHEVAERIVSCVNAMAGIENPTEAIAEVRAFLRSLVQGEHDADFDLDATLVLAKLETPSNRLLPPKTKRKSA